MYRKLEIYFYCHIKIQVLYIKFKIWFDFSEDHYRKIAIPCSWDVHFLWTVKWKYMLKKISLLYTPTTSNLVLTNWLIMRVTPIIWCVSKFVDSINVLLNKCELLVSLIKWFSRYTLKKRNYSNYKNMMIPF